MLETMGKYLKGLRIKKGVTIRKSACCIGVSPQYISLLERGKKEPSDDVINEIARYYDVDSLMMYRMLDRIPKILQEELAKDYPLQHMIKRIIKDKEDMNKEEKKSLYLYICKAYNNYIRKRKEEKET